MSWWGEFVRRGRADRELAREMDAHKRERMDDLVERGLPIDAARRQAALELGNTVKWTEESRAVWIASWLTSVGQDLRYVLRMIRRQPVASASIVLILALGIGLVTALFSVVNAEVLRPWPIPDPSSVVILKGRPAPDREYGLLSHPEYRYFREHAQSFSHIASSIGGGSPIGYRNGAMFADLQTKYVTANYFDALRIGMEAGRDFLPEEEDYVAPKSVVVISERVWREYFASDPEVIGSPIRVGDFLRTVVGVAERGFADTRGGLRVDLWMPLPTVAIAFAESGVEGWLKGFNDPRSSRGQVFGRLKPGVTATQANAELDVLSRQFRRSHGMDAPGLLVTDTRPWSANQEGVRNRLATLPAMFAALMLIMLLACTNVSNLILANTIARQGEIAIRLSLGASRARVARQLLTETLVLSFIAGAIGLYLAVTVPSLLIQLNGSEIRNRDHLSADAPVFLFALGMSLVACMFASLGPALRATRATRIRGGKDAAVPSSRRLRAALLATQIALSTVLLIGAGLLTRAISHAMTIDPGFAIGQIQELTLTLPPKAPAADIKLVREALMKTRLPPTAFSELNPITSARMEMNVRHAGQPPDKGRRLVLRPVSSNYFEVLGIPLLSGRTFDDRHAGRELVISQSAARLFWPNDNPLGQRLLSGPAETSESHDIVGIVADVPTTTLTETEPVIYRASDWAGIVLTRDLSPAVSEQIKALAQSVAPGALVSSRPLVDAIRDSLTSLIAGSRMAWGLGLLALLLAGIGAFGVFASMVEERRREIGTRMALGAEGWQVVRLVLSGAAWPVATGLLAGLALSLVATPVLRNSLHGMSPFDPIAYIEISGILLAAALAATWIPALRATRIEPAITLRGD
jgi:predicted permease